MPDTDTANANADITKPPLAPNGTIGVTYTITPHDQTGE